MLAQLLLRSFSAAMTLILKSFSSLYFASLLMLFGSGLLSTYLGLRLAETADGFWVGALMAANYLGLVVGGKLGHHLIARVGHIRAYVACAGVVTAAVLVHGLTDSLPIWIALRLLVGVCMMCQYMVVESWLNEQADTQQRGQVFACYMGASYMGLIFGQLVLVVHPGLGTDLLMIIALCFALCLVPVALTQKLHPAALHPAPIEMRFFLKRLPLSLLTIAVAGLMIGSFYGLAPLYGARYGLTTEQIGMFMGCCIFAGLIVQWPLGWLSDRIDRVKLIRTCSGLLAIAALPLAVFAQLPIWGLFAAGFAVSMLLFCLYPLAVAFANDHVENERRVSLTVMLLVTFGLGAAIGPLLVGVLMRFYGPNMLYAFFVGCGLLLFWRVKCKNVTNDHQVQEAPLHHIAMPDAISSSPLVAALDPRIDEHFVQEQMCDEPEEICAQREADEAAAAIFEAEAAAAAEVVIGAATDVGNVHLASVDLAVVEPEVSEVWAAGTTQIDSANIQDLYTDIPLGETDEASPEPEDPGSAEPQVSIPAAGTPLAGTLSQGEAIDGANSAGTENDAPANPDKRD